MNGLTTLILLQTGSIWEIISETSPFGMFILIALALMSFISWVIIFAKWRQYREVQTAGDRFLGSFKKAAKLSDVLGQAKSNQASPLARMFLEGHAELSSLNAAKNPGGMADTGARLDDEDFDILEMALDRTATEEISKLERKNIFLATTGNSAPFMGLLGTVVGIMDSFWAIGEMGSASLAVVAPGIAEALLATIVGLGAAIPAVIAYNWANNKTKMINDQTSAFTLDFLARARKESR